MACDGVAFGIHNSKLTAATNGGQKPSHMLSAVSKGRMVVSWPEVSESRGLACMSGEGEGEGEREREREREREGERERGCERGRERERERGRERERERGRERERE